RRRGGSVGGVEQVQLRRHRCGAEGESETAARLVEIESVEDAAREPVMSHEHALQHQRPCRLVEPCVVRPGATVDVEEGGVPVALEMLKAVELAPSLVREPAELYRLDLSGTREVEISRGAPVVEQRRHQQYARRGGGDVRRADS